MTTNLTVTIADQQVPLDDCIWLERRPCGCIVAAVVAVVEGEWTLATADQAHQHLNPTKRDRDRAAKAGLSTELTTAQFYREQVGARWECAQHARPAVPAASEETHVVADDSDDPEHVDDCPGCNPAVPVSS